jgi:NAD(P)-dependent dehydrogenase (short-subunit alcohol dehydrogenase family)
MFAAYNASKAALSAFSRVIDTEWGHAGVHSTTLYYPLVATPMIAPTRAYDHIAALTAEEAADWMVTAANRMNVTTVTDGSARPRRSTRPSPPYWRSRSS